MKFAQHPVVPFSYTVSDGRALLGCVWRVSEGWSAECAHCGEQILATITRSLRRADAAALLRVHYDANHQRKEAKR